MYYLESDDRDLLKKLLANSTCSVCGGKLEALYDPTKHLPYLQCTTDLRHEGIAKENREPRELNTVTRRKLNGKRAT